MVKVPSAARAVRRAGLQCRWACLAEAAKADAICDVRHFHHRSFGSKTMACVTVRENPGGGPEYESYNADFRVGRAAANRKDDVMLVQALLRMVYIQGFDPKGEYAPLPDEPDIMVDGIVGPITQRYIMHFKDQARRAGVPLYPDQCMDPIRHSNPQSVSTIRNQRYALGVLLEVAERARPDLFSTLPEHKDTPEMLRRALRQRRGEAQQYGG
ncbi:MAG: hypothetical protein GEV06_13740 [Luteitalea sp.]|nr:hypothetical protein [Luteitalea sp.]